MFKGRLHGWKTPPEAQPLSTLSLLFLPFSAPPVCSTSPSIFLPSISLCFFIQDFFHGFIYDIFLRPFFHSYFIFHFKFPPDYPLPKYTPLPRLNFIRTSPKLSPICVLIGFFQVPPRPALLSLTPNPIAYSTLPRPSLIFICFSTPSSTVLFLPVHPPLSLSLCLVHQTSSKPTPLPKSRKGIMIISGEAVQSRTSLFSVNYLLIILFILAGHSSVGGNHP